MPETGGQSSVRSYPETFVRKPFAKVFFSKRAMKSGCQVPKIGGLGVRCRETRREMRCRSSKLGRNNGGVLLSLI